MPGATSRHDQARSRAYRWGEDGLAGVSDDKQRLCFALALWNGKDPILKERLFGLTNAEGNHGEDVKEYYFYLDSTPTHSYMKWLYKYPQRGLPVRRPRRDEPPPRADRARVRAPRHRRLRRRPLLRRLRRVREGGARGHARPDHRGEPRARRRRRCTSCRRSGSGTPGPGPRRSRSPGSRDVEGPAGTRAIAASHPDARRALALRRGRTRRSSSRRTRRTSSGSSEPPNPSPFVKDGIHEYVVHGRREAVNPDADGDEGGRARRL